MTALGRCPSWPARRGPGIERVREQLDPSNTAYSGTPTQEDQYWGRAAGTDGD